MTTKIFKDSDPTSLSDTINSFIKRYSAENFGALNLQDDRFEIQYQTTTIGRIDNGSAQYTEHSAMVIVR